MADKIRIRIIGFQHYTDRFTSQQHTQIIFGIESRPPSPLPDLQRQNYCNIPKTVAWKHVCMYVFVNTQYKVA